jgi:hypothetical protein
VGSALSFFLVSNFAVWVAGTMYPMSWAGLIECYVKAIPFFRNELISAPLFSAVFFGLPVLYSYTSRITASKSAAA